MVQQRIFFEKNQPVHILSRAVEGTEMFKEKNDCYRFVFQLYAANWGRRGSNVKHQEVIKAARALLRGDKIPSKFVIKQHEPLIHLLDFALVRNHYHFYLLANVENAVPLFMQKLNNGFAKYFNLKHGRKDALFGSRYKSIPVETGFQSDAVARYIRIINPLDVFQPGWREKGLESWDNALKFLKSYEFSSFPDRMGERSARILAPKGTLEDNSFNAKNFGGIAEYLKFVEDFLKQKTISFQPFFLE